MLRTCWYLQELINSDELPSLRLLYIAAINCLLRDIAAWNESINCTFHPWLAQIMMAAQASWYKNIDKTTVQLKNTAGPISQILLAYGQRWSLSNLNPSNENQLKTSEHQHASRSSSAPVDERVKYSYNVHVITQYPVRQQNSGIRMILNKSCSEDTKSNFLCGETYSNFGTAASI